MIWDSSAWKVDLRKRAEWLRGKKGQRRWPESSSVKVEQCIMIGCYCIRKLIEARKLSQAITSRQVAVLTYKHLGETVHSKNWHKIDKLYDLGTPTRITKPLEFVCNQLIHSFVYIQGFSDRGGLSFVMFASDFQRNRNLFQISVDQIVRTFVAVSKDDIARASFVWNEDSKDYDTTAAGR